MTKEELEKEAEEYTKISVNEYKECLVDIDDKDVLKEAIAEAFLASAEPREKENAELRTKLEALEGQTPWKDIKDKSELIKENAELKDEWQEQVQKAIDEGYARTLQTMQLSKAKELLIRFVELKNKPCAVGHSVNMLLYDNICADVEQFLNEVEKWPSKKLHIWS